jgi:hypothetical protein
MKAATSRFALSCLFVFLAFASGCDVFISNANLGTSGHECYENGKCNVGYICAPQVQVCVPACSKVMFNVYSSGRCAMFDGEGGTLTQVEASSECAIDMLAAEQCGCIFEFVYLLECWQEADFGYGECNSWCRSEHDQYADCWNSYCQ